MLNKKIITKSVILTEDEIKFIARCMWVATNVYDEDFDLGMRPDYVANIKRGIKEKLGIKSKR